MRRNELVNENVLEDQPNNATHQESNELNHVIKIQINSETVSEIPINTRERINVDSSTEIT